MALRTFFFLLTIAEVVTIVASFKLLGFWLTIGLCIGAMALGGYLLKTQGIATAERFVNRLEKRQAPMDEAWDGFCILIAACLFIIPGLATDFVALLLLLPPVRGLFKKALQSSGTVSGHYWFDSQALRPASKHVENVIEADYIEIRPEPQDPHKS